MTSFLASAIAFAITVIVVLPWASGVLPSILGRFPKVNDAVSEMLFRCGEFALTRNLPRCALAIAWCLGKVCAGLVAVAVGHCIRAAAEADRGRTQEAVKAVDAMLATVQAIDPNWCSWVLLNSAIDVLVNAGLYQKAVCLQEQWSVDVREQARQDDRASYALAQINRAEAFHNLGQDTGALALLDTLDEDCQDHGFALHGRALLRAWILAHAGKHDEAKHQLESVDARFLGARYRAEFHYTHSLLAREIGDLGRAVQEGRLGLKHARRRSSCRNGLLLVAAAEFARNNLDVSIFLLGSFRRHRYRGQAAAGLLLLGLAYERAGRPADAKEAYAEAIQQDPESHLIEKANERLAGLALNGIPLAR